MTPLWISGPPPPDSRRSLRRATYPQLLHYHQGQTRLLPRVERRLAQSAELGIEPKRGASGRTKEIRSN
jgi:hypothetical protein